MLVIRPGSLLPDLTREPDQGGKYEGKSQLLELKSSWPRQIEHIPHTPVTFLSRDLFERQACAAQRDLRGSGIPLVGGL